MSPREKPPTVGQVVFAALDLTEEQRRLVVEVYERLGQDPAAFEAWFSTFLNQRFNAPVIMRVISEARTELFDLIRRGKGPVSHDPVDLS